MLKNLVHPLILDVVDMVAMREGQGRSGEEERGLRGEGEGRRREGEGEEEGRRGGGRGKGEGVGGG